VNIPNIPLAPGELAELVLLEGDRDSVLYQLALHTSQLVDELEEAKDRILDLEIEIAKLEEEEGDA
jgi:hypothetical protein